MNCLISQFPKLAHYQFLYFSKYTYTLRNAGNGCQCVSPTPGWSKKVSPVVYYYSANVLTLTRHPIFFKTVQTLHQNYFDISLFWFHLCCVCDAKFFSKPHGHVHSLKTTYHVHSVYQTISTLYVFSVTTKKC